MGVDTGYGYVLVEYWVVAPYVAVLQAVDRGVDGHGFTLCPPVTTRRQGLWPKR